MTTNYIIYDIKLYSVCQHATRPLLRNGGRKLVSPVLDSSTSMSAASVSSAASSVFSCDLSSGGESMSSFTPSDFVLFPVDRQLNV